MCVTNDIQSHTVFWRQLILTLHEHIGPDRYADI